MSSGAAVVGGGFMAEVHTRGLRATGARLVGVSASDHDSASAAAASLGYERSYPDLDAMLADPAVDVVHVCTPNATHAPIAKAALAAGKHVVCEKPLATRVQDARDLVDTATDAGLVTAVPFVYRFHPMVREARERVRSGRAGRLFSIQASYLQDWLLLPSDDNWRVGDSGGPSRAFADIGSHLVDLVEFVTGQRLARIMALTRTVHASRANTAEVATEDLVGVLAETDGGAVVSLLISQVAPGRKNSLVFEVHGEGESLRFDQESPESLWIGRRRGSELLVRNPDELSPDAARLSVVPAGHPQGYQDAFNALIADAHAAVAGEAPEGLPTFADGLRAALVTEAVLASAASGNWAYIDE